MRKYILVAIGLLFAAVIASAAEPAKAIAGFDAAALDTSVEPCTNFYQYACGGWLKANPIPADQTRWGRFSELYERNRTILRDILEQAAAESPRRSANEQKIGDYYASCMDTQSMEAKGLEPLKPQIASINAMKSKRDLPAVIAGLHRAGVDALFGIGSEQDAKNTTEMILVVSTGGLGLPERDYYFRTDARSEELRTKYVQHVENMLRLAGQQPEAAARNAGAIMEMEKGLAKGMLDVVARRSPSNVYHKLPVSELTELAPNFEWKKYFTAVHAPQVSELDISEPEFFRALNSSIAETDIGTMKSYLLYHLLTETSGMLPERFDKETFSFYNTALRGQKEQQARWKRCAASADGKLGEAVGKAFVERAFGPESKARVQAIVANIQSAMRTNLAQIDWMTDETKKQAYAKLEKLGNKIGYPETWRDYSSLSIVRGDGIGNALRANEFAFRRSLGKIGKPVDRLEWVMSPPTVNAYYEPTMNDINFPAGILQPPFFSLERDETYNYGGIGAVIGHELTHGFDDEGRQFDLNGNLREWWTKTDNDEFNNRADCFVQQYGDYPVVEDVKLNGKLTLGENVADGGGLRLAMMAALASLADDKRDKVDGFTPEQRVFLGFGQIWCNNATPQSERMQALTDPHSLSRWRVNGTVSNMPEFQNAWQCSQGTAMVRQNACRVW